MADRRDVRDLVDAVIAGEAVDWARAANSRDFQLRQLIPPLRALEAIGRRDRLIGGVAPQHEDRIGRWALPIMLLAGAQILIGSIGAISGYGAEGPLPVSGAVLVMLSFAASAVWLVAGATSDPRALALAGFYLVIAAAFARRFAGIAEGTAVGVVLRGICTDAFLPAFLWAFVSRFPQVPRLGRADRACRIGFRVSVAAALLLFVGNLAVAYIGSNPAAHWWSRSHQAGTYWGIVLGLSIVALPVMVIRLRVSRDDERRRVTLFCSALCVVLVPLTLETLLEVAVPAFEAWMSRPEVRWTASFLVFGLLAALPFVTTYAVIVERVLDVRIVIGRTLRYLLTKAVIAGIAVLPAGLLIAYGIQHSDLTIGQLFAGPRGLLAIFAAGIAGLLVWARPRLLTYVDRAFFRTSIDFARALSNLTSTLRTARSAAEVHEDLETALQGHFGASFTRMFLADTAGMAFVAARGTLPSLAVDSACGAMLQAHSSPVPVGVRELGSMFSLLPGVERDWVGLTGSAILVPIAVVGRDVGGFLAVGGKRSELAFTADELSFATAAVAAASLALEMRQSSAPGLAVVDQSEPATECSRCRRVHRAGAQVCDCGGPVRVAALPAVLHEKFLVEAWLGAGGMGTVYRAQDISLNRPVALKTLSRLTTRSADRLAQEARIMASVVHPNLATIYGIERWRNTPILAVELLEGGSLADRLRRKPMSIPEVLRLGLLLAPALEQLHQAGVLHLDIKPSNIAFTGGDVPKLLDFGLATHLTSADNVPDDGLPLDAVQTQPYRHGGRTIAGTPLYVPPEALHGAEPGVRFDLWALTLVLFEAIAGSHPYSAQTVPEVLARVRDGRLPDLGAVRPGCPGIVTEAFKTWLASDPDARPPTATGLREALSNVLTQCE